MKVGIIGGTGKMGHLFAGVFERAGHEVRVCGRTTVVTCQELAQECDLVMVSVPIRDTVEVIRRIAPLLSPGQVLCDLTSLKVGPVTAMLESAASVIGFHPMFGPGVPSLRGQTIVATPVRCTTETLHAILSIFECEGAGITISTPEEHDRVMALVQGLTHSVTLLVADTMRRLAMTPEETAPFMSPVYQIEMGLVGRLLSQEPDLYGDILRLNPFVPPILAAYAQSLAELREIVDAGDAGAFSTLFERNAAHFGSYCTRAAAETDFLIRAMVDR
ncbi:MAG: prephenate dehydrogenase/arogenate dehydrogenase family protein [Methanomicrobiales archaeon]|nr:prephenate dehydrogenase/arogenate dehydrogenase family protein [Methanomicrobiales archaeon]NYT20750.1 prephenate dehydrogenase/arogenate dehydrogenase family protein [Methanomicrobiales archaeon]